MTECDEPRLLGYQGKGSVIVERGAQIGVPYCNKAKPVIFHGSAVVRSHSVIYGDVSAGDEFQVGHGALIREKTTIGEFVLVGSNSVIDGQVIIGDFVKIQTGCYIPTHCRIGNRVFLGPHVVLTNDRMPLKRRSTYKPEGPVIEDGVTLGAGVVVLPGVVVGSNSFVAAGAVVTRDVPSSSFVVGIPGQFKSLPDHLAEPNNALNWPEDSKIR